MPARTNGYAIETQIRKLREVARERFGASPRASYTHPARNVDVLVSNLAEGTAQETTVSFHSPDDLEGFLNWCNGTAPIRMGIRIEIARRVKDTI